MNYYKIFILFKNFDVINHNIQNANLKLSLAASHKNVIILLPNC